MNKNRHIIGELQELFANKDSGKAINSLSVIQAVVFTRESQNGIKIGCQVRHHRPISEYFASKIETAISMLKRSIIEGVRFDYLLVDSWFTCAELLKFVV